MKSYQRIQQAVYSTIWAIQPEKLQAILAFLAMKVDGGFASADVLASIRAANADAKTRMAAAGAASSSAGSVAVLPLYGVISQRISAMDDISGPGGTSTENYARQFRAALADPSVKAIVLDIDSPGGTISGVPELADEIYKARGKKQIVAVCNSLAASAAYWIGCSAGEFVCTPSGLVGSIGVYDAHDDISEMLKMVGEKVTYVAAGKYKVERNPAEPLGEEARAYMKQMVDEYYGMFTRTVARNRNVKADEVRNGMGEGRVVTASQAVKLNMCDRVATLDQVLADLGVARSSGNTRSMASGDRDEHDFAAAPEIPAIAGSVPKTVEPDAIDIPVAPIEPEEDDAPETPATEASASPVAGKKLPAGEQDDTEEAPPQRCECLCTECQHGDCANCSDPDCSDPNCEHGGNGDADADAEADAMAMSLAIVELT